MFKSSLNLLKNGSSGIHTSVALNGKNGRILKKIMGGSKKKSFYNSPEAPVLPSISTHDGIIPLERKITGNSRRSSVLNKVFMRHITDLMATGEYSSQIIGYGIEVNKVKVSPDYRFVKVYWIAKDSEDNESIENLLKKNAGALRHELSQLRVMGEVPNIVFVKDKTYAGLVEVQNRLLKADFGEDYEETDLAERLKTEYEVMSLLDDKTKQKRERLEGLDINVENLPDELKDLPPMPQNVLGLDHSAILGRIKKGLKISEANHRKDSTCQNDGAEWNEYKVVQSINSDPVRFTSQKAQREAFREFLHKRQIMKNKHHKVDKNWTPDRAYITEELRERHLKSVNFKDEENLEDDYVIEEFEEHENKKNY